MNKQKLRKFYKDETKHKSVFTSDYYTVANGDYMTDYVKWLEQKVIELSQQNESNEQEDTPLPDFLIEADGRIITACIGGADVTNDWNKWLMNNKNKS